jgi:pimeloyl-ACP methyl ester carboxylesterase
LIGIDRPGVGSSTPHLYGRILDWADDFAVVSDRLGVEECALIGLSGGGPYALACCAALPERITAAAVLGGVAPTKGPDATTGGVVGRTALFAPILTRLRTPAAVGFASFVWALRPFTSPVYDLYARISPEGDRRLFARPEIKTMLLDDIQTGSFPGMRGPVFDLILFGDRGASRSATCVSPSTSGTATLTTSSRWPTVSTWRRSCGTRH